MRHPVGENADEDELGGNEKDAGNDNNNVVNDGGVSGSNYNAGGNGGNKQAAFPILVRVRVDKHLQVVDCTAILSLELRNTLWSSKIYEALNKMVTNSQQSRILPPEPKMWPSEKYAALDKMVTGGQHSREKGEPNIVHIFISIQQHLLTHTHFSYLIFRCRQRGYIQRCEYGHFYLSSHERENNHSACIQDDSRRDEGGQ